MVHTRLFKKRIELPFSVKPTFRFLFDNFAIIINSYKSYATSKHNTSNWQNIISCKKRPCGWLFSPHTLLFGSLHPRGFAATDIRRRAPFTSMGIDSRARSYPHDDSNERERDRDVVTGHRSDVVRVIALAYSRAAAVSGTDDSRARKKTGYPWPVVRPRRSRLLGVPGTANENTTHAHGRAGGPRAAQGGPGGVVVGGAAWLPPSFNDWRQPGIGSSKLPTTPPPPPEHLYVRTTSLHRRRQSVGRAIRGGGGTVVGGGVRARP